MICKIINKILREFYRLSHPSLWGKHLQINGIPRIYCIRNLKFGNHVSLNEDCMLQCYGGIIIGDRVTISDGAKVLTRSLDTVNYISNALHDEREHIDRSVSIGDGTWIATNVIILPGVHISENCIVAAGSVVTKDLNDAGFVYGGIPAKKIRKLD